MRDALARSIHFIVWTNFVRADVYLEWAAAMMLLAVVVCVVMSSRPSVRRQRAASIGD